MHASPSTAAVPIVLKFILQAQPRFCMRVACMQLLRESRHRTRKSPPPERTHLDWCESIDSATYSISMTEISSPSCGGEARERQPAAKAAARLDKTARHFAANGSHEMHAPHFLYSACLPAPVRGCGFQGRRETRLANSVRWEAQLSKLQLVAILKK